MNYYNATSGTTGATTIVQLPLAFVRDGWVSTSTEFSGSVRDVGGYSFVWSRTSLSLTNAYPLGADSTDVNPSGNWRRYYGFSLRCRFPALF